MWIQIKFSFAFEGILDSHPPTFIVLNLTKVERVVGE
jgi:hypothetical protein